MQSLRKIIHIMHTNMTHNSTGTVRHQVIPMGVETPTQKLYTEKEFMDELAKRLGRHFGLNDIREVK